jgi:hypothetical protein
MKVKNSELIINATREKKYHGHRNEETNICGRVFGSKRGSNRRIGKNTQEELHNLYTSPTIIKPIKSWKMKGTGHVERTT